MQVMSREKKMYDILKYRWHEILLHFLVDCLILKLGRRPSEFYLTIFLCNESTIWRPKSVPIKRAAKTVMLHSCDVENCEDTSATMVEKGEI